MSYGIWDRPKKLEKREYFEKTIRRQGLSDWDAKWHILSVGARQAFLDTVQGPKNPANLQSMSPTVAADKFAPELLAELVSAGFVTVAPSKAKNKPDRVEAVGDVYDFATRVRKLKQFHLLQPGQPLMVEPYIESNSDPIAVSGMVSKVLTSVDLNPGGSPLIFLRRYVVTHRWPTWVLGYLKDSTVTKIIHLLRDADGPIPLVDLPDRIAGADPASVRAAFDKLLKHLAVFEDLDPKTLDIIVDFLPAVRADLVRAVQPQSRPPLEACDSPKERGPEAGIVVEDLRAFLLEIASDPPRLRQDGGIFAKDLDRFHQALLPIPEWMVTTYELTPESRLEDSFDWAEWLGVVKETEEGKSQFLRLSPRGEKWLADSIDAQYAAIIDRLRAPLKPNELYDESNGFLFDGADYYSRLESSDYRFLAGPFVSIKKLKNRMVTYRDVKVEDRHALRESIYRVLSTLTTGVFYTLQSLVPYLTKGPDNPLLLGRSPDEVAIYRGAELLPMLEEEREIGASDLFNRLFVRRLLPLGALQAAIDENERILVTRTPLLDLYFGRKLAENSLAERKVAESRVVVQPDFSVIIIGLNPAPAAALAPFCDRQTRGGTPGAMILKITRESVIRAVANGLKPAELVARLKKFASVEVPPNVLKEVQTWGDRVRHVTPSTLTVLRCPDRETADRVVSALKRGAERITETLVSIDVVKLTSVERNKLKEQGIIVKPSTDPVTKPKAKPKRDRWDY